MSKNNCFTFFDKLRYSTLLLHSRITQNWLRKFQTGASMHSLLGINTSLVSFKISSGGKKTNKQNSKQEKKSMSKISKFRPTRKSLQLSWQNTVRNLMQCGLIFYTILHHLEGQAQLCHFHLELL